MPGGPLSRAQIESIKANGVLILEGFVEEAQLARWREQVWAGLGASPDDPDTWPKNTQHPPVADGISPTPGDLPQFQALSKIVILSRFDRLQTILLKNVSPLQWSSSGVGTSRAAGRSARASSRR